MEGIIAGQTLMITFETVQRRKSRVAAKTLVVRDSITANSSSYL
jgi:hypothetical protein